MVIKSGFKCFKNIHVYTLGGGRPFGKLNRRAALNCLFLARSMPNVIVSPKSEASHETRRIKRFPSIQATFLRDSIPWWNHYRLCPNLNQRRAISQAAAPIPKSSRGLINIWIDMAMDTFCGAERNTLDSSCAKMSAKHFCFSNKPSIRRLI